MFNTLTLSMKDWIIYTNSSCSLNMCTSILYLYIYMYTKSKSWHQKNKPYNRVQRPQVVQKQQRINIRNISWEFLAIYWFYKIHVFVRSFLTICKYLNSLSQRFIVGRKQTNHPPIVYDTILCLDLKNPLLFKKMEKPTYLKKPWVFLGFLNSSVFLPTLLCDHSVTLV